MSLSKPKGRKPKGNTYVTRSGQTIKLNRNLIERFKASKESRSIERAKRLAGLPKSRFKRLLYHLQPSRMYHYWFSREGAVMALKITGIGIVACFVLLVGAFAYFRKDLPNIADISGKNIGGSVRYYDRSGKVLLWEDVNGVKRIPVKNDDISPYIKDATVSVEDKDFFHHGGFDIRGIIRAALNNLLGHGYTQGGSTITQQLVRLTNTKVGYQQTITRKIKELILAVELEREYSKKDILVGYLNTAPYGGIEYGVEAAARDYFHKSAKDLTLDEAAMLAAIPKAPCYYSFYCTDGFDKQALVGRQHYILDLMAQQHMITDKQRDAAKKVDTVATIKPRPAQYEGIRAPWFVLAARNELENRYAENANRSGWNIVTTLDLGLQKKAEDTVAANIPSLTTKTRGAADEEAIVMEDVPTGQIVALVGGTDFTNPDHGQNNYAAQILIPPGSSFKPYDYTTLINNNKNIGAGSVLYDREGPLPGYPCTTHFINSRNVGNCLRDYDGYQPGPLTLRYALGGSRNIPAVKAMLSAVPNDTSPGRVDSINKTISTASAMMDNPYNSSTYNCYADEQLKTKSQCYGASAIGDGAFLHLDDHVNGLATLGRLGQAIPKTYILKIQDSGNKTLFEYKQPKGKQVIQPDTAYIVDDMASDPRASYLPGHCTDSNCSALPSFGYKFHRFNGWKFAIKTGTTNNGFDGLMTSWSTKYAVVSWVGNHFRNLDLNRYGYSMEYLTEPLTRPMMEAGHTGLQAQNWAQPADVKSMPAFVVRNHVHYGDIEPSPSNDLFPSWYNAPSRSSSSQTIDIVSNKIATDCTPQLARKTDSNANSNIYSVDVFVGGGNSNSGTSAKDDVHSCDDIKPSISIVSAPQSCNGSCTIVVSVNAGTHPLSSDTYKGTVNIIIDGQTIQSFEVDDSGTTSLTFNYNGGGTKDVSTQVIDSVLYDSTSDSASIDFSSGGGGTLTFNTAHAAGGHTNFNWSGGTPTYTVYLGAVSPANQLLNCTDVNTSNCQTPAALPNGTTVIVQDSDGNTDSRQVN
ncbi:MAG TPA: transglycosylase domain-containing protein [Candidatus Saccharimonadales bacterium]|nr:transglycosylase domain-containing protein [Candidatus Saccharimonadales bacterium]